MLPMAAMAAMTPMTAGTSQSGSVDPRLKPAAHEFEACLMKEFLEPLQHDALFAEDRDGASGEGSGNALMNFGSESLAKAISERGGFGIANKILHDLNQAKPAADNAQMGH